ncbi:MAG TPA: OmpA family protein, partial [Paracoccaceae bacterium]|nr:OmpA family protein [Paracoccaceae bacterium]
MRLPKSLPPLPRFPALTALTARLSPGARQTVLALAAAATAAGVAALAATWAVGAIEARTVAAVKSRLLAEGILWAGVSADGMQIHLTGTAPNEAARFRAVNLAGGVIDAGRIRDGVDVPALRAIEPPRFSVEILRNLDGISLIGLLPAADGEAEAALAASVAATANGLPVADMLESADYAAPPGWDAALAYGLEALKLLPRSKISVAADRVAITAIADSADQKRGWELDLARRLPPGLEAEVDISAPRPVLTPFTLRFVLDAQGARFDACSADTERARDRILAAARAAGVPGRIPCTVGLGVPTPRWAEAAEAGIRAVVALGEGAITFSDADVTLLAGPGVEQAVFDRVVGDLQATLPQVFSVKATLPPKDTPVPQGPAEFTAVLADSGKVELRGRLTDDLLRAAVDSFARAHFGADAVYAATLLDPDLPDGWPVRVFAGLAALSELHAGRITVRADTVEIAGVTGDQEASRRVAQVLSDRLGQGQDFTVDVRYEEALDPVASLPTAEECVAGLNDVLAARKITFAPGSSEIDTDARGVIEALSEVLRDCPPLRMEVAGHTDSQGSEGGNRALSQARAESVLVALQG